MNVPATATVTQMPPAAADRSLGALLVDAGKITLANAEQILQLQKQTGVRFGEVAVQLGFLKEEDLRFALARQYNYPCLRRGESQVNNEVVAAYQPDAPQVEALRALRSQLMLRWFTGEAGGRALAIVSPGRDRNVRPVAYTRVGRPNSITA